MPKLSLNASKKTKHTPAGEIPVDWGWAKLREVCSIQGGNGFPEKEQGASSGDLPFIKVSDLNLTGNEKWIRSSNNWISFETARRIGAKPVQENAVVFAKVGAALLLERRRITIIPTCIDNNLMAIHPEKVDSHFLYQFTLSFRMGGLCQEGVVPSINGSAVGSIPIPLPPLPEQRRIADILTTWDRAIETLESLIAAKERRKQALMEQLLTGRKRLPGFTKDEWRKVRMNEIMERIFRPIDWHADKPLSLVSLRRRCGGLFRRPDMLGSEYKTQDLHELKTDDFLISKRQVSHGAWGIVPSDFQGCHVSKEYAIVVKKDARKLHMPFFAWLAQTPRMIRLARVASTGVHIEKLIFDPVVFLRESISIPPTIKEQQAIAAVLDTADRELSLHRQHLESLRTQKRGLMQKLLTGEVRVQSRTSESHE
jgi:type I restriction enzyme, S subunit